MTGPERYHAGMQNDYPSDEQMSALLEMAIGLADCLSMTRVDPDWRTGDSDQDISILLKVDELVWGEGPPDSASPPVAKAMEAGFTKKEACAAYAAMSIMWSHLNTPSIDD